MGTAQRDTPSWPAMHRDGQTRHRGLKGRGKFLGIECHKIPEHLDALWLGQNVCQVRGSLNVHHDKNQTRNIIAQAFRIPQDVFGLAEGDG